jgi:hypothetical protein
VIAHPSSGPLLHRLSAAPGPNLELMLNVLLGFLVALALTTLYFLSLSAFGVSGLLLFRVVALPAFLLAPLEFAFTTLVVSILAQNLFLAGLLGRLQAGGAEKVGQAFHVIVAGLAFGRALLQGWLAAKGPSTRVLARLRCPSRSWRMASRSAPPALTRPASSRTRACSSSRPPRASWDGAASVNGRRPPYLAPSTSCAAC